MLSDSPSHNVFVLLSPNAEEGDTDANSLPDILAVVQTSLEGKIERKNVEAQLSRGKSAAGDLIPWTIAQQVSRQRASARARGRGGEGARERGSEGVEERVALRRCVAAAAASVPSSERA
jgi:hypothetical protein